ncbi:LUD domain-containing protein [Candidatus Bathyarchaeota archaeon]|nr:LUD domain-containing protein [Candidatus Bathyarchaeota archaeon]
MIIEELAEEITKAQRSRDFQLGLKRAVINSSNAVDSVLSRFPELIEIAEYVKIMREKVLDNLEFYVEQAIKNINATKAHAYFASDPRSVLEIVDNIIGEEKKIIVKAKSMVTEEIFLREHLAEKGHEVYETDLGQFLIQISKEKPMHIILPAIHKSREQVALILKYFGLPVSKEATYEELVLQVREFLREKFVKADVGITGANAIAADTGAVLLIHNEGNHSLVTTLPSVHIVVASAEKIVPTFKDALLQLMVQAGYAGLYPPTYINMIAGPSSTADIEYYRVYGVQGAREVHVILYDGGRIKASKDSVLKEQLLCIKCGRCQILCPIWSFSGCVWGAKVYGGPLGVGLTAITEGVEKAEPLSWFCIPCKACKEACPVKVDCAEISRKVRSGSIEKGLLPPKIKEVLENIYKHGNPYGLAREKRADWADAKIPRYESDTELLYYVGDMGSYHPRVQRVSKILANTLTLAGVSFGILGLNENCSGSEAYEIGEMGLFEEIAGSNVKLFKRLGVKEIVTLSPHSYNVMKNFYGNFGVSFEVKHYTQLLWELIKSGKFNLTTKINKRITYHDPCFLGRWNGIYEAPRDTLNAIPGVNVIEMRRNKQNSSCCGGGGGNCYTGIGCGLIADNEYTPSRMRVKEAYETGADVLAVACPSCLIMLDEAVKEEGLEESLLVMDVAEIVSLSLTHAN